jgi:putative ABC transport system ATP-binding protein
MAPDAGDLFELERVSASRGSDRVLREVSLTLPEGASCIAGPSGSGKSTLLRLLNRLAEPDSGGIAYRGRPLPSLDVLALRREVALVPQLPALLEGTVADNVHFGAQLAGREANVAALLDLAGLPVEFADRGADLLSVGEQQRVMLARALALEPRVLLLDEPTSALDERTRDRVEATLLDLRRRTGISLVLVTHDLAQAERLADRVLPIEDGRVAGTGETVGRKRAAEPAEAPRRGSPPGGPLASGGTDAAAASEPAASEPAAAPATAAERVPSESATAPGVASEAAPSAPAGAAPAGPPSASARP